MPLSKVTGWCREGFRRRKTGEAALHEVCSNFFWVVPSKSCFMIVTVQDTHTRTHTLTRTQWKAIGAALCPISSVASSRCALPAGSRGHFVDWYRDQVANLRRHFLCESVCLQNIRKVAGQPMKTAQFKRAPFPPFCKRTGGVRQIQTVERPSGVLERRLGARQLTLQARTSWLRNGLGRPSRLSGAPGKVGATAPEGVLR